MDFLRPLLFAALISCSVAAGEDFRRWTDRSGDFTVQAKFVELLKDGESETVVLEDESGEQFEIAIQELDVTSRVNARIAATRSDNSPQGKQKESASPFKKSRSRPQKNKADSEEKAPSRKRRPPRGSSLKKPRRFEIKQAAEKQLELAGSDFFSGQFRWSVPPDAATFHKHKLPENGLQFERPFAHEFQGMVASQDGSAAVAIWEYTFGKPENKDESSLIVFDLANGTSTKLIHVKGHMYPMAITSGGDHVLVGLKPEIQNRKVADHEIIFASVNGTTIIPEWVCKPFADTKDGPGQFLSWAAILPSGMVAIANARGDLRIFDPDTGKAVRDLRFTGGGIPTLSPTGKQLAVSNGRALHVYDTESFELLGATTLTNSAIGQRIAFHADGTEIAVAGDQKMAIIDVATGKIRVDEIPLTTTTLSYNGPYENISFHKLYTFESVNQHRGFTNFTHVGDSLYLYNEQLIESDSRMHLWTYSDLAASFSLGGETFLLFESSNIFLGIAGTLPHPTAQKVATKFRGRQDLYALQRGDAIRIDASVVPKDKRGAIVATLTENLEDQGFFIRDDASVVLELSTKKGATQTETYVETVGMFAAKPNGETRTVSFTPTLGVTKLLIDGREFWGKETYLSYSSLPSTFSGPAKNVAANAAEVRYEPFTEIFLPLYIFDPSLVKLPFGSSYTTRSGFRDSFTESQSQNDK